MSSFETKPSRRAAQEGLTLAEENSATRVREVQEVSAVSDAVADTLAHVDWQAMNSMTAAAREATVQNLGQSSLEATMKSLEQAGEFAFMEEEQKKQSVRALGIFSAFIDRVLNSVLAKIPSAEEKDLSQEKSLGEAMSRPTLLLQEIQKILPFKGSEAQRNFEDGYKSIVAELVRRMSNMNRLMKHVSGGPGWSEAKIALSLTTLMPFALLGEVRSKFDLAHKTLWWLRRTSRQYIEGRYGSIGEREPQDQLLRSEASSFPLAVEVPRTDVASILVKKLERYAQKQEEYFLTDGTVRVLVWERNAPSYLTIPLEWFSDPALTREDLRVRVDALLQKQQQLEKTPLSDQAMLQLRDEAYGKYSDHTKEAQQVFQADIALVLDRVNVHDVQAVMRHPAFLTAGARVRETLIFERDPEERDPLRGVTALANKFAHTHIDGKKAKEMLMSDLDGVGALAYTPAPPPKPFATESLVNALDPQTQQNLERSAAVREQANWSEAELEHFGHAVVGRERSLDWIHLIGAFRSFYKENTSDALSFGTADIFAYAHLLASKTTGMHFLESRQLSPEEQKQVGAQQSEVLDVAFNVIPEWYLDIFSQCMEKIPQGSRDAKQQMARVWQEGGITEAQKNELREHFLAGLALFLEEKKRAKQSDSFASFMSTLAGGLKQVEKLMQLVSQSRVSVGDLITKAIGNPRGGLVSMLAQTREVPKHQENGMNMLWFGSANSDNYIGTSNNQENWGGALGIGESSDGFVFLVRKVAAQVRESLDLSQYEKENKHFAFLLTSYLQKSNVSKISLRDLPAILSQYEQLPTSQKADFFGDVNHAVVYRLLLPWREKYFAVLQTQRQAEQTIFAVEFLLQLLASHPDLHLQKKQESMLQ